MEAGAEGFTYYMVMNGRETWSEQGEGERMGRDRSGAQGARQNGEESGARGSEDIAQPELSQPGGFSGWSTFGSQLLQKI